jgi:hypothetical protein
MHDLNDIDSINSSDLVEAKHDAEEFNRQEYNIYKTMVESQYIDFDNLGVNYLKTIPNRSVRFRILQDFVEYTHKNYLQIPNYESFHEQDVQKFGEYIYNFICVDLINSVLPKFFQEIGGNTEDIVLMVFEQFRRAEYIPFKNKLIESITGIIKNLNKLGELHSKISSDSRFKFTVKKYGYYLDLVDFSNPKMLFENLIEPISRKYMFEIFIRAN